MVCSFNNGVVVVPRGSLGKGDMWLPSDGYNGIYQSITPTGASGRRWVKRACVADSEV